MTRSRFLDFTLRFLPVIFAQTLAFVIGLLILVHSHQKEWALVPFIVVIILPLWRLIEIRSLDIADDHLVLHSISGRRWRVELVEISFVIRRGIGYRIFLRNGWDVFIPRWRLDEEAIERLEILLHKLHQ